MRLIDLGYTPFYWAAGFDHTEWHAQFQREPVQIAYRALAKRVAASVFRGEPVPYLFQREPNLRIHPPGGTAVPWHTDADFGHLPEEWNVWIPLTETTDDSQRLWTAMWDYRTGTMPSAARVPLGSAFVFHGAIIPHGNQVNATDDYRVSFDFRLIEKCYYRDTGARSVLYNVPLRVPEYWEEMTG